MTREEAVKELKELRNEWSRHIYSEGVRKQISLDMAIKALEQENVLVKIRAEIENTMKYQYAIGENQYAEGFEKSLEIIDKYKAESENKE